MSRKRDFERARRHHLVIECGAAPEVPQTKAPGGKWDTLAEERGWTRPAVTDWRTERQLPRGRP